MSNEIIFAGDWHAATHWGKAVVQRAEHLGIDTIYHVGDFGYMGGGVQWRMDYLSDECVKNGVKIWVTPGNHENWVTLDALFEEAPEEPSEIAENIFMLPRGFRWERAGVSFMSMGGAPSIDRNYRAQGIDWWPEEAIEYGEALRVIEDGYVDVMITHDAPTYYPGIVYDIIHEGYADSVAYWGQSTMEYCAEGHKMLNGIWEGVKPRLLVHGHYHVWDHWTSPDGTQDVIALHKEGHKRNAVVLDLDEIREGKINPQPSGAYYKR